MSLVSSARNNSSKRRACLWHLVRKTITKGLHDGADVLNQRETQQEGPSTTGAWIYLGGYLLESYSSTADCGKTHVTAGRATAARRGVGHVQHLDARFSWLQQLWAEGLVHWCLRSSQSGDQRGRPSLVLSCLYIICTRTVAKDV